jgi:hypothetical protein
VMHSRITAPGYNWPQAEFTLGAAAFHNRSVAVRSSPRFPELSPFVPCGGKTTRW